MFRVLPRSTTRLPLRALTAAERSASEDIVTSSQNKSATGQSARASDIYPTRRRQSTTNDDDRQPRPRWPEPISVTTPLVSQHPNKGSSPPAACSVSLYVGMVSVLRCGASG